MLRNTLNYLTYIFHISWVDDFDAFIWITFRINLKHTLQFWGRDIIMINITVTIENIFVHLLKLNSIVIRNNVYLKIKNKPLCRRNLFVLLDKEYPIYQYKISVITIWNFIIIWPVVSEWRDQGTYRKRQKFKIYFLTSYR